jgi:hypothetical protein
MWMTRVIIFPARVGRIRDRWSHLTADDKPELHAFAQRIGLQRSWFQDKSRGLWHYDVTEGKRREAVAAGAVEISWRNREVWSRPGRDGRADSGHRSRDHPGHRGVLQLPGRWTGVRDEQPLPAPVRRSDRRPVRAPYLPVADGAGRARHPAPARRRGAAARPAAHRRRPYLPSTSNDLHSPECRSGKLNGLMN